jgi:hypothetical protein
MDEAGGCALQPPPLHPRQRAEIALYFLFAHDQGNCCTLSLIMR